MRGLTLVPANVSDLPPRTSRAPRDPVPGLPAASGPARISPRAPRDPAPGLPAASGLAHAVNFRKIRKETLPSDRHS